MCVLADIAMHLHFAGSMLMFNAILNVARHGEENEKKNQEKNTQHFIRIAFHFVIQRFSKSIISCFAQCFLEWALFRHRENVHFITH